MHYNCTTFHLYSENYTIELPFPEHGGADYSISKDLVKFNFWSGAWSVEDAGLSGDEIHLSGYDWDEDMSIATYVCDTCYIDSYASCEDGFRLNCFNKVSEYDTNPGRLHIGRWGICFNPKLCIIPNCMPPVCFEDGACFYKTNEITTAYDKVCNKIVYSEDFMEKFEDMNALMDNHETIEINELGDCVDGVYVIADFTYEVVQKVPGLFQWNIHLKKVKDI